MKGHVKFFVRGMVLLLLIGGSLRAAVKMMTPKYYYDSTWSSTATYHGFYEMDRDSIDVLFLGSSHAVSAFNVQMLYNEYGITSYNMGCEQQNLLSSYYWLKEALRFQSPKVVILDVYMLFDYYAATGPLNATEGCIRRSMDYMKWSKVKAEAVRDICTIDPEQTVWSYYLPNIRFHTRWTNLSENDFTDDLSFHYELKGFSAFPGRSNDEGYKPFAAGDSKEVAEPFELMREYLDRIIQLCERKGIKLILVKTPVSEYEVGKYNTTAAIAEANQVPYYDFNEEKMYNRIDFKFVEDMCDNEHASILGAIKITGFFGDLLTTEYGIETKKNPQWEETRDYYETVLRACEMIYETEIDAYLDLIHNERYSIFISVKGDAARSLDDRVLGAMKRLGLAFELEGKEGVSYLAVCSNGEIYEQTGYEKLEHCGTIRNGATTYEISSAGGEYGNESSIIIDGAEWSKNKKGLNIVVYDNLLRDIVDSVAFNTSEPEFTATR